MRRRRWRSAACRLQLAIEMGLRPFDDAATRGVHKCLTATRRFWRGRHLHIRMQGTLEKQLGGQRSLSGLHLISTRNNATLSRGAQARSFFFRGFCLSSASVLLPSSISVQGCVRQQPTLFFCPLFLGPSTSAGIICEGEHVLSRPFVALSRFSLSPESRRPLPEAGGGGGEPNFSNIYDIILLSFVPGNAFC